MPKTDKQSRALTAAFVASVRNPGKYHDGKGMGLFLLVKPSGARSWVQRVTIRGKRRDIGLGSPAVVTLAEAREVAMDNKRLARSGEDPLAVRQMTHADADLRRGRKGNSQGAFTNLEELEGSRLLPVHFAVLHVSRFGSTPLPDVTGADLRQAILAARQKARGVAKKTVYRTSFVFRRGIAEGLCADNPTTSQALALPRKNRMPKHRKALRYNYLTACIEAIKESRALASTKLALEFLILTASRSGEVRHALWSEIDLEERVWIVPADRAKQKRPHRVPLSDRAMGVLADAETLKDGSGYVFPSLRANPLSDMTLSKLVKEPSFDADVHGFRTSFRTWGQERMNFPREVLEAALGHTLGDAAEQAYARSDLFEKRCSMMGRWAEFLENPQAKVTRVA